MSWAQEELSRRSRLAVSLRTGASSVRYHRISCPRCWRTPLASLDPPGGTPCLRYSPTLRRRRAVRDDGERFSGGQLLEKLRGFGIELNRAGLAALCQGAFSAQEVAAQLTSRYLTEAQTRAPESDGVWLAVLTLWQRWWPARPCLETLDDKIQNGYAALAKDLFGGWLSAVVPVVTRVAGAVPWSTC